MIEISFGGGAVGFNWLPVLAAERQGIFERHGLRVSIKRMGTVDKATAGVKSGELNIAITPPEGAIRDCAAGGNLRIDRRQREPAAAFAVANPRFKRIEELKGAKLGTSSLTEGTAIYTMEVLRQHGLNYPGDYEFAVVGVHPARWKALQEGTIDAAVQLIPLNFVAFDAGYPEPRRSQRLHPRDRLHRHDRRSRLGGGEPRRGGFRTARADRSDALGLRSANDATLVALTMRAHASRREIRQARAANICATWTCSRAIFRSRKRLLRNRSS